MNRKQVILAYQAAVIVPLVAVSTISVITGIPIIGTVPGLVGSIILLLACLISVHFAMKRKIDDTTTRLVNEYDLKCDPEALTKGGGQIAYTALQEYERGDGLGEEDVWFLSYYALASIDTGDIASAEKIATAVLSVAQDQSKFITQAAMLANIEPVVLRLRGAEEALAVIEKAEEFASYDQGTQAEQIKNYIAFEKKLLTALASDDQDALVEIFTRVMRNDYQPMRMRVLDADALASIHRARGDESSEIEALNFVETFGNKLPVVQAAADRLEELF